MAACLRRNTLACVDDTSIKEEDSVSGQPVQMQAERKKLKGKQGLQVSGGLRVFLYQGPARLLHCLVTSSAEGLTGDLTTESLIARFGAPLSGMKVGRRP